MTQPHGHVETRWLSVDAGRSERYDAYLALPPGGHGPGLVLYQEIFGINAHMRDVAEQYAHDGFVVLAPDLFWRQTRRAELAYEGADRARALELMAGLRPEELDEDVRSSVAALRAHPAVANGKVGALGYCLGGRLAFFAAAIAGVDAAVAYYGGGIQARLERVADIRCPMQFHYAGEDHGIPPEAVEEVRTAVSHHAATVFVYQNAGHGFNCPDRSAYHAASAALAHGRTLAFLAEHLY